MSANDDDAAVVVVVVGVVAAPFSAVVGNSVRATDGVGRPVAASMLRWPFVGVCGKEDEVKTSCLRPVACETLRSVMAASCCSSSEPRSLNRSFSGESSVRRRLDGVDGSRVWVEAAEEEDCAARGCCCCGEDEEAVLFCAAAGGVPDPGCRMLARSCQRKKSHCRVEAQVKKKRPLFLDSFFT